MVQEVQAQGQDAVEQGLHVPGQRSDGQECPCPGRQYRAFVQQRTTEEAKDQRQPGSTGNHVQVAKVGDEQVREHEGCGPGQCCPAFDRRAVHVPPAQVCTHSGQVEVGNSQQFHGAIGQVWPQHKEDQVGWIEEARLVISNEWRAAVQVRIPQRDVASLQAACREAVGGIQERDQIASPHGHPGSRGEEKAPEESGCGQGQGAQRQGIVVVIVVQTAALVQSTQGECCPQPG